MADYVHRKLYLPREIVRMDGNFHRLSSRETFLLNRIQDLADELIDMKNEIDSLKVRINSDYNQ